ncbi:hypothetical protein BH11PSE9_BH11PSE9_35680 [soil metagenome]
MAASLASAALVALLAGCASPSPAPILLALPPAITGAPAVAAAPAPGASAPLLAIRRVNIPEYLVARRVRFRADAATLAEWPNTYWAERIEIGVSREFVSALRQQLPGWAVCDSGCGDQSPTLSLQVDIVPMDYVRSAQKLVARARITLQAADVSQRTLQSVELAYEIPAGADTAQAQAQAVTELIRQVATATAPLVVNAKR